MLSGQKRPAPEGEEGQDAEQGPVDDPRFKAMFEREDFAIDEDAQEYRALHPNRGACSCCFIVPLPLAALMIHSICSCERAKRICTGKSTPQACAVT